MHSHKNAALTVRQRTALQIAYRDGATIAQLAKRFAVDPKTARKWATRTDSTDRSSAAHHHGGRVVTEQYRHAVLTLRRQNPNFGPRRIADELRGRFPTANSATIWRILNAAGLSERTEKKTLAQSD